MAQHRMRLVKLLELLDFLGRKADCKRGNGLVEMLQLACADDGRSNVRLAHDPGQRDLRTGRIVRLGNFPGAFGNRKILRR